MAYYFMVKIYSWFLFFNKDNPRITYQKLVKLYQWSKVLYAPLSHTTISSICEIFYNRSELFIHAVCGFVLVCQKRVLMLAKDTPKQKPLGNQTFICWSLSNTLSTSCQKVYTP